MGCFPDKTCSIDQATHMNQFIDQATHMNQFIEPIDDFEFIDAASNYKYKIYSIIECNDKSVLLDEECEYLQHQYDPSKPLFFGFIRALSSDNYIPNDIITLIYRYDYDPFSFELRIKVNDKYHNMSQKYTSNEIWAKQWLYAHDFIGNDLLLDFGSLPCKYDLTCPFKSNKLYEYNNLTIRGMEISNNDPNYLIILKVNGDFKIENSDIMVNKLIIICNNSIVMNKSHIVGYDVTKNCKTYWSSIIVKCRYLHLCDSTINQYHGLEDNEHGKAYFEGKMERFRPEYQIKT